MFISDDLYLMRCVSVCINLVNVASVALVQLLGILT